MLVYENVGKQGNNMNFYINHNFRGLGQPSYRHIPTSILASPGWPPTPPVNMENKWNVPRDAAPRPTATGPWDESETLSSGNEEESAEVSESQADRWSHRRSDTDVSVHGRRRRFVTESATQHRVAGRVMKSSSPNNCPDWKSCSFRSITRGGSFLREQDVAIITNEMDKY